MYLSVSEAAEALGISVVTLKRWEWTRGVKPRRNPKNNYRQYTLKQVQDLLKKPVWIRK